VVEVIEIRGQQASDWRDVYELRCATAGELPFTQPDIVRDELAQLRERTWPMVALIHQPGGPRVAARLDIALDWGRRGHCAWLTLEQHPEYGDEAGERLLFEGVSVAERWWNRHRVATTRLAKDEASLALFTRAGFQLEARLRKSVRIAGRLEDEVVLARVTGPAAQPAAASVTPPVIPSRRPPAGPIRIRGAGADDWEAYHRIWSQPNVFWGTMQLPFPSADWNRDRFQNRRPERTWRLVAEMEDRVIGALGLHLEQHHRAHAGHIGMMVDTDFQGMGVGSALMQASVDLAEGWLGLTRIQLEVYPDNLRAIKLYERYGFEPEGLFHALAYRDGQYIDAQVMSRLRVG
jgi:putative acetyltransferase